MADLIQMTGALKNPSSAVSFPSQPIFFFPPKNQDHLAFIWQLYRVNLLFAQPWSSQDSEKALSSMRSLTAAT